MNNKKLSILNERRLRYKNDKEFRDDELLFLLQVISSRIMEKLFNSNYLYALALPLPLHEITRTIDVDIKVLADRNLNLAINSLKRRIKLFLPIANSVSKRREISPDYLSTLGRREYEEVVEVWEKNLKYAKKLRKAYYYILSKVKYIIRMNASTIDAQDHLGWCKSNESKFYTSDNLFNLELTGDYNIETEHNKGKVVIVGGMVGVLGANHCLAIPFSIHPVTVHPTREDTSRIGKVYLGNGKEQNVLLTDDLPPRCVYIKKLNDEDQINLFQFKDIQQTRSEFRADLQRKMKKKPFQVMNEKFNRKKR